MYSIQSIPISVPDAKNVNSTPQNGSVYPDEVQIGDIWLKKTGIPAVTIEIVIFHDNFENMSHVVPLQEGQITLVAIVRL